MTTWGAATGCAAFDSTVIAGSRALVDALVADPTIEALEVPEGADLSSTRDTVKRAGQ